MKKIIVIGCPGSGKSRLSRKLCAKLGMPLCHLDMLYWNADKTTVEKRLFLERLGDAMGKEEWIIDGNYASTMEIRMKACDTVIFLDFPTNTCLSGIKERLGKPRSDMPWVESEESDDEFIEFIKNYNLQNRPQVLELLKKYSEKRIFILNNREEADEFLTRCLEYFS